MQLLIYNTLTRMKEPFEPLTPGIVRMYVCGPTPYDHTHIGHARTYVAFDLIRRFLEFEGYTVIHVMNITDIDDKILRKARETVGLEKWKEIPDKYSKEFFEVLDKMYVKRPHYAPRVTEHIEDIVKTISILIDKGYAYVSQGSVYFEVDKYSRYGQLSKITRRESWRQEMDVVAEKKKPYDFALWKRAKPGEPYWNTPWGPGRPGWHIECTVMGSKYLGVQFDIHGGGQDLIFPHHENEIAQAEACYDVHPWVKYWIHIGYLTIKGEKMSKSLGNIIPVQEVFSKYDPLVLKLYLISAHYRTPLDFSWDALNHAAATYNKIENFTKTIIGYLRDEEPPSSVGEDVAKDVMKISVEREKFLESLREDFNTSKAMAHLHTVINFVNRRIVENRLSYPLAVKTLEFMREFNEITGLLEKVLVPVSSEEKFTELMKLIVELRNIHRRAKNYELADWIRGKLSEIGIKLIDQKDKTIWVLEH